MNLDSLVAVEHPPREHIGASQTVHIGAEAYALHHSPNPDIAGDGHYDAPPKTQPRPCQPTWITLPSSTRTGTVVRLLSNERKRSRASGSASMSYSRNSRRRHSSDSRNSCV